MRKSQGNFEMKDRISKNPPKILLQRYDRK